ncbi:MAG: DNA replication and repair protein RecF, partial [Gammaproteobacteria bacterium]
MSVKQFRAENIRCLQKVRLEPAGNNLIFGENASGKTSLLEALFILGRGRSFRRAARDTVIRDEADSMTVAGTVLQKGLEKRIGLGLSRSEPPRIRVDGRDESTAAILAEWMPVQIIDPDVHNLIAEGPLVRRRFLDWGLFHVEPGFLDTWRRYQRVMKQRNAALRIPRSNLDSWDEQLVTEGEKLSHMRARYAEILGRELQDTGEALLQGLPATRYRRGWPEGKSLAAALQETRDRDRRLGISHVGPHRAD